MAENFEVGFGDGSGDCEDITVERSSSKNSNGAGYLTPKAKLAFTKLRKAFTIVLIPGHFDLKCHIQIKTDVSGYTIGKVLS